MSTDTADPASPAKTDVPHEVVVTCPATGQVVGRVPVATSVEVEAVAARLRAAQPGWQQMGVDGRARWLGKWRDWLLDHTDELLTLLQLETGKSWGDTCIEIAGVQIINYWIDKAAEFLADESVRPYGAANAAKKLTIAYEPYPLVGVITPWNGPLSVPLIDIPAALMAGLRRALQAVGGHPAGVADGGRRMEADRCSGRARRGVRVRPNRGRLGRSGGLRDVHRLGQYRAPHRRRGRTATDPVQPGTRRQRRDDRLRRRRHRPGRRRRGMGRLRLHRPSLHIGRAVLRRGTGVRRVRQQGGGQNGATAPRHGRRTRLFLRGRLDDHRAATRHCVRPRRRRRQQGRAGAGRRQVE